MTNPLLRVLPSASQRIHPIIWTPKMKGLEIIERVETCRMKLCRNIFQDCFSYLLLCIWLYFLIFNHRFPLEPPLSSSSGRGDPPTLRIKARYQSLSILPLSQYSDLAQVNCIKYLFPHSTAENFCFLQSGFNFKRIIQKNIFILCQWRRDHILSIPVNFTFKSYVSVWRSQPLTIVDMPLSEAVGVMSYLHTDKFLLYIFF